MCAILLVGNPQPAVNLENLFEKRLGLLDLVLPLVRHRESEQHGSAVPLPLGFDQGERFFQHFSGLVQLAPQAGGLAQLRESDQPGGGEVELLAQLD